MRLHRACPLCGWRRMRPHHDERFVSCDGCGETLRPTELVLRATRRTRLTYNRVNGHTPLYGLPGIPN